MPSDPVLVVSLELHVSPPLGLSTGVILEATPAPTTGLRARGGRIIQQPIESA